MVCKRDEHSVLYSTLAGNFVVINLDCGAEFGFSLQGDLSRTVIRLPSTFAMAVDGEPT